MSLSWRQEEAGKFHMFMNPHWSRHERPYVMGNDTMGTAPELGGGCQKSWLSRLAFGKPGTPGPEATLPNWHRPVLKLSAYRVFTNDWFTSLRLSCFTFHQHETWGGRGQHISPCFLHPPR